MGKARMYGMTPTPKARAQMRFKKGKPNNSRCPKCQAKLKRAANAISCGRCGYSKIEEEDNLTKAIFYKGYESIF